MSDLRFLRAGVAAAALILGAGGALAQAADGPGPNLVLEVAGEANGRIVIDLLPDLAPKHAARLTELAGKGAYDNVVFHRVIDGFMAQTGCPHGTGTGGSKLGNLPAEFNAEPHVRGVCSMARASSPNSANSQFFIVFDDATFLDKQYTVWGKVIEGMGRALKDVGPSEDEALAAYSDPSLPLDAELADLLAGFARSGSAD